MPAKVLSISALVLVVFVLIYGPPEWHRSTWCWELGSAERASCYSESNVIAAWVSAGATTLALIFAFFAAQAAFGQLKALRDDKSGREQEARRRQAAQISAWLDTPNYTGTAPMVLNSSNQPVYSVIVTVANAPTHQTVFFIPVLPPTPYPVRSIEVGEDHPATLGRGWTLPEVPGNGPRVCPIEFVDAEGRSWARDGFGTLEESEDHLWANVDRASGGSPNPG